jgi:hypothetical protein
MCAFAGILADGGLISFFRKLDDFRLCIHRDVPPRFVFSDEDARTAE